MVRDHENRYLSREPREESALEGLLGHSISYRIALGPPAGRKAFDARRENRTGLYSYENRPTELDEAYAETFRRDEAAWAFFQSQSPSYRKMATWWVLSAAKEETRLKRLAKLVADSARGRRV